MRPATIAAVRPMAAGSSTDVPPNFMTTRLMRIFPSFLASASGARGSLGGLSYRFQLAQACQQFGVQNSRARGAANSVVRQHHELPVQQAAGAQATHGHRHSIAAIAVETGLGAIILRSPLDGLIGGRRQSLSGQRTEL